MNRFLIIALFFLCCATQALPLEKLELPAGFTIDVYAEVPNARSLTLGDNDVVFVGNLQDDKVYAVIPNENRTKAKAVNIIANHLTMPNGVAYHKGSLYVAEMSRILRFDNIMQHLDGSIKPVILTDQLPNNRHHGWRYLRIGPDNKFYIGIGAPCNVCVPPQPRFATITRMNLNGTQPEIVARGVRNTVGFDWHPTTKELWFTENGRDWLGDNLPPEELNRVTQIDQHYGFPYFYGQNVPDPVYGKDAPAQLYIKPVLELPAHTAPLGMNFYTGQQFPEKYRNQIFIAQHGSWNKSSKVGYQVILVNMNAQKVTGWQPFITGWLKHGVAWGRPVDVLTLRDGSLLISDDLNGVIYRVAYHPP